MRSVRPRDAAPVMFLLALSACVAVREPRPPAAPSAAPIPLVVGVCPGAAHATEWLARAPLFTQVVPITDGAAATPAPHLVVSAASADFQVRRFEKPRRTSTKVTSVFSILSLGILPTYFRHEGHAELTFQRPATAALPCARTEPPVTHVVRVEPAARELLAFWVFVPGLIAALPGWDLRGGDDPKPPTLAPEQWLPDAIRREREALLKLAAR